LKLFVEEDLALLMGFASSCPYSHLLCSLTKGENVDCESSIQNIEVKFQTAPNTAPLRGIYDVHPIPGNPGIDQPGQANAGAGVVGLPSLGTACAFSGTLCGVRLVPSKQRSLVPPTSGYPTREEHPPGQ